MSWFVFVFVFVFIRCLGDSFSVKSGYRFFYKSNKSNKSNT